jgi:hypothetical protein
MRSLESAVKQNALFLSHLHLTCFDSILICIAEFERQRKEREAGHEDALTMRLRLAEEQKKKTMAEFEKQAKGGRKDVGTVEKSIREKHAAADAEKQRKLDSYKEMGKTMAQAYHAGLNDHMTWNATYLGRVCDQLRCSVYINYKLYFQTCTDRSTNNY